MRFVLLAAIRAYQRYLSPYKGFCCAYRFHTGRASCSTLGYRAVRRFGIFSGLGLIRERLSLCGVAHRRYHSPRPRPLRHQRGDCDCGGGDCGGGDGGNPCDTTDSSVCKLANVCDSCPCDCGGSESRKNKKGSSKRSGEEEDVYIPPPREKHHF